MFPCYWHLTVKYGSWTNDCMKIVIKITFNFRYCILIFKYPWDISWWSGQYEHITVCSPPQKGFISHSFLFLGHQARCLSSVLQVRPNFQSKLTTYQEFHTSKTVCKYCTYFMRHYMPQPNIYSVLQWHFHNNVSRT